VNAGLLVQLVTAYTRERNGQCSQASRSRQCP
jgi:hypothetical protein